ncbi:MAG: peptidoglycan-binding protein [Rhodospirillales bacterium]|nr:peptidoglycan-binding protein [Rhodospirillales bacterium]
MTASFHPAWAATLEGDLSQPDAQPGFTPLAPAPISHESIQRLQTALSLLDLYKGNITGDINALTERAVREYQRRKGLPATGIVDDALIEEIETAANVITLLDRLSTARKAKKDSAREALLNHPATRDLIADTLQDETANAARDPSLCFRTPTVRCLLDEALESAKAVARDEMRNWVFGELLVAQARAGLGAEARDTVRRISDPRLIISALGQIAKAQALSGRDEEALAAASIIPDIVERVEAYATIAEIAARKGRALGATAAIAHLRKDVRSIGLDTQRIALLAQSSIILHRLEFERDAKVLLASLQEQAKTIKSPTHRESALRHIARAMVMNGDMVNAGIVLTLIVEDSERTPVMISTAEMQMSRGEGEAALATANAIKEVRFRAVVLASIARTRAQTGQRSEAFRILVGAYAEKDHIRFPFARDYATSQIALAYAEIGASGTTPDAAMFSRASRISEEITDERLRAETAWLISFSRHDSGANGLEESKRMAIANVKKIKSVPARAWLLAELSENRASAGQPDWAWELFYESLKISETVTNPWGRARSLTRLAQSLIHLAEASLSTSDTTLARP